MAKILSFQSIAQITQGNWINKPENIEMHLQGGAFDTRTIEHEEIFFAFNQGINYLNQLENTSIKLAIIDQEYQVQVKNIAILKVENSLLALQKISQFLASQATVPIISITGSNGKTTTKEILSYLLSDTKNCLFTKGNFNNEIGCPITLLQLGTQHEVVVLEMGASSQGDLHCLSSIIPADIRVLLNVGHAHVAKFGSLQNTYKAKLEIFDLAKEKDTFLVCNDKKITNEMLDRTPFRFGQTQNCDYQWEVLEKNGSNKTQKLSFSFPDKTKITIQVPTLNPIIGDLICAALAVCDQLQLDKTRLQSRLKDLPILYGRGEYTKGINQSCLLDESYNANPEAVIVTARHVSDINSKKKIYIIGNLAELEKDMKESAPFIAERLSTTLDEIILTGESGKWLYPVLESRLQNTEINYIPDIQNLLMTIKDRIIPKTTIAVKGSRSAHLERVVLFLQTQQPTHCYKNTCYKLIHCKHCEEF